MTGTVKWFDDRKGYGFITDGDKDYFVHYSEVKMSGHVTLDEGQKVEFEISENERGPCAVNVVPQ